MEKYSLITSSVIFNYFLQAPAAWRISLRFISLFSDHHQIILHTGERAVGHKAAEGLRFSGHQLDVRTCLLIDSPDSVAQDDKDLLGGWVRPCTFSPSAVPLTYVFS